MRAAVAVFSYFAVAFGVPVPSDPSPPDTVLRGDMQTEKILLEQASISDPHGYKLAQATGGLPASTQAQLSSQAQTWAPQFNQHLPITYQPSQNAGLPLLPAQTQYQPMYQMPQFVYFPMFGASARNPTLAYAMPAFYPTSPVQFPAVSGRPIVPGVQTQTPTLGDHGQSPQQQLPYHQQTPQIIYVVRQPVTQPFGGISSEEIQAQRRLDRLRSPQLVPQLGTRVPPGSAGPFVPLRQPPFQPLNPGFPAVSSVVNPVLFSSVPAMPNIPNVQIPTQPIEETLSTFGALPDEPEASILAEHKLPSAASPSHSSAGFEKPPSMNPTIEAPTVMTENPPEPTASVFDVYS